VTTDARGAAVTVVIPARDAAATIDAQLAALAHQDHDGPLHVVLADNGSSDDTAARAAAWADRFASLRVVDASARRGPAFARNAGTEAAPTELVLLCDADDIADRSYVRHLSEALADADAVAGGTVDFHDEVPDPPPAPQPFGTAGFGFLPGLMSCSCGYRKSAWAAVGGFDAETYPVATCEDIDFAWRLQLEGFRLVQAPAGFVFYRNPPSARRVLRTWYRYGRYQPVLQQRFGPTGLRPEPSRRVAAAWVRLVLHSYRLVAGDAPRRRWCRELGRRVGRAVGSLRCRTRYL
jgi:glycosyltransferase involved in cell wall biosynthesis